MALSTSSNFVKPDDAFRAVVEAHRGLSDAESADLDARWFSFSPTTSAISAYCARRSIWRSGASLRPISNNSSSNRTTFTQTRHNKTDFVTEEMK